MARRTRTSSFGVSKRESHDASGFYSRTLYANGLPALSLAPAPEPAAPPEPAAASFQPPSAARSVPWTPPEQWADRIYCHTSEAMDHVPDGSVGLAFTSPPYNDGKEYDADVDLRAYLALIGRVAAEVYRVLKPGGRYVVNVANLGRKPYVPMHAYFYAVHSAAGFLPAGEIIWRKGKSMSGSCAWGSWRSARAPRLRDVHEYLLVFAKGEFRRPDAGESDIPAEEFLEATISVWDIPPESARRVGHPAPFPVALAERVIRLYSYVGDVVLDPFCGSGSTCVAARLAGRHYVGYDIVPEYCELARHRLAALPSPPRPS
ncbi:site-specific DNA-methyltransferase [Carboxydochorda subterranea]|uniref:Methyltransferase n=1 Tax=Carboxydichorda subterranea TaxID=3109565 RepID=A0ABZ1BYP5_9FIRM|nr:site-specific DNA-methyltransferase [Limnochorda sp. L945t]WRP17218.1 site-specific DNA-methyltransferase [Limnochorda sp. L945t]